MDKNINAKSYQVFLLLKGRTLTLEELKLILKDEKSSNILKSVCSSLRHYVEEVKQEKVLPKDDYPENLKKTIDYLLTVCSRDIGSSLRSLKNIESRINKCACKKELFAIYEEINTSLLSQLSYYYQNHQYRFLLTLIEEIHNVSYLKYILNTFPYYINTRDDQGQPIVLHYLDKVLSLIDENKFDRSLIYYHSVVLEFMQRERFHLSDTVTKEYLQKLFDRIDLLDRKDPNYRKKIGYYKKYSHCLSHYEEVKKNMDNIDDRYEIRTGFDNNVQCELSEILKRDYIITIDPEDTPDMDDALSIEKVDDHYRLKVYIANVADTIRQGGHIDLEAYKRVETLYYAEIPMLPAELSNSLLSLNTFTPKNVFEFSVDVYENGCVGNFKIAKKCITVNKNYSFHEVDRVLDGKEETDETLFMLSHVAGILRSSGKDKLLHRTAEELINYRHWIMTDQSTYKHRTKSEIIIEESMILMNFLIANYFKEQGYPFMYRVHDKPKDTADYNKLMHIKDQILSEYTTKDEYVRIVNTLMSMYPKAYYSLNSHRHFGLDFDVYSHSTSPIRRYPDILVQRLLNEYVFSTPTSEKDKFWIPTIEQASSHCNDMMESHFAHQEERSKMKVISRIDY